MALLLKEVESARGPRWIADAFALFFKRPIGFTAMFVVFLSAAAVVGVVPLLGGLVRMMAVPLLSLGFMVAAQSALRGGPVRPGQFIEPLRTSPAQRRALLVLCAAYGLLALLSLLLADAVSGHAWGRLQPLWARGESAGPEIAELLAEPGVTAGLMLFAVLGSVLSVPFWHAPALVHWGGQGVQQALFSSTVALWRSKGALFTYVMAWVAVTLVFAAGAVTLTTLLGAPQWAGLLVMPAGLIFSSVFYISLLFMFNDSFGDTAALPDAAQAPPSTA